MSQVIIDEDFLTQKKYWINYLKFDTPLFLIYYAFVFIRFSTIIAMIGIERYIGGMFYGTDILVSLIFIIAVYFCRIIPKKVQETLIDTKSILIDENKIMYKEETYHKFIDFVSRSFSKKKQKYIPLIAGIITILVNLGPIFTGWDTFNVAGKDIELNDEQAILNIIQWLGTILTMVLLLILCFSVLMQIITTFSCINKLEKSYKLHVTYSDLKTGIFENLGLLIITLTIPIILIATIVGLTGAFMVIAFNNFFIGPILIALGISITFMMTYLLYKDTISIHQAIIIWKNNLLMRTANDIEIILKSENMLYIENNGNNYELNSIDYDKVQQIHNFYDEILEINDWPFNPTSIKKLVITVGSSIFPVLLSLLGLV